MNQLFLMAVALVAYSSFSLLYAQQLAPNPSQILEIERTDFLAAQQWAKENDIPEHFFLTDESIVGIVGFRNGHPVYYTTHNQKASTITGTSRLYTGGDLGFSLDGNNLAIGIWDASLVFESHQEHKVRVIRKEKGGAANHATHVAGTLIASGIIPEAKGMAPQARLHSYNWNFHLSEMVIEAEKGMLISNHSYGRIAGWHKFNLTPDSSRWQWFGDPKISTTEDYTFGFYDQEASNFDHIAHTYPYYLPVVSAGNERDDNGPTEGVYLALDLNNRWIEYDVATHPLQIDGGTDGFDTITSMALAKNALTVGSIYSDTLDGSFGLSVYSSVGPTDDGRIKPDLVGVGEHLFSSIATGSTEYATYSGTSMATPNISGSLILLQQLSNQLFGKYMKAATLKGLAIHTAQDLGPIGPDYKYGWGILDAGQAALQLKQSFRTPSSVQEQVLTNGSVFSHEMILAEQGDIQLTLSWTDPRFKPLDATDSAVLNNPTPVLIHNLNIRLINNETSEVHFPYTLSYQNPHLPAKSGVNNVDPIEQVFVQDASAGIYTIIVDAPEGLSLSDQQPFSLIVTGLEDSIESVVMESAMISPIPGDVILTWSTLIQNAPGRFLIERAAIFEAHSASQQTSTYEEIGAIESVGASQQIEVYRYTDPIYIAGLYKYRILFQSSDSQTKQLLEEFEIELPAPQSFEIVSMFPNPASERSTVVVDLPEKTDVILSVYNSIGQQVIEHTVHRLQAGRHMIPIELTSTSQGIYFVRIQANEQDEHKSFVVIQ